MDPLVCFEKVTYRLGGRTIIEGADFCLHGKGPVSIVGPNGGGKTTLVKLMLGLLEPTQGTIQVLGATAGKHRAQIGYLPQKLDFDPLYPLSVEEVVLTGRLHPAFRGGWKREDRAAMQSALEVMRVQDCARARLGELSGGELQRVLIARALACEPRLLLLDEPTSYVDPIAENELLECLRGLEGQVDVIMVSHHLNFVSRYVEEVLCVHGHVHLHPTGKLDEATYSHLFSSEVRPVHHDVHLDGHHHHDD